MDETYVSGAPSIGSSVLQRPRVVSVPGTSGHVPRPSSQPTPIPMTRRCNDLLDRLLGIAADADVLANDVNNNADFDLFVRFVEASHAVHRAVLALDLSGGSNARPVTTSGRS